MNSFFDNQNVNKQAKGIDIRTNDITKKKNNPTTTKPKLQLADACPANANDNNTNDECYQELKNISRYLKYFCNNK